MSPETLMSIKRQTNFDFYEILHMSSKDFFFNITRLLSKGKLTMKQHKWLEKQRTGEGLDQLTLMALEVFDKSELIK